MKQILLIYPALAGHFFTGQSPKPLKDTLVTLGKQGLFAFLMVLFLVAGSSNISAQVKLPRILGSNMVLQQGLPIPVWGWASKGEKVTVSFNGQKVSAKADAQGKWKVRLQPVVAGGPFEMNIQGKNLLVLKNILVGEVWVCSGQSNMEWPLQNANIGTEEVASANYPRMRLFTVPKQMNTIPQEDIKGGEWLECNPSTAPAFSAVGYFFGRGILKTQNVPVGLIHTSWGGTNIEDWTSIQKMASVPEFKEMMQGAGKVDFEQLQKEAQVKEAEWYKMIETKDKGIVENWKSASIPDATWQEMILPTLWETAGLPNFDGVVWFRKEIMLTAEEAKGNAILSLGPIDDSDYSFINGVPVGSMMNQYNINRVYKVESGILKEGKNVIVVRVIDTGGGGGLWGDKDKLFLQIASGRQISLAGPWKYQETITGAPVQAQTGPNSFPSMLFNAMINPLIPYGIKGAIWYQGENNADRAYQYRYLFPNMINDWRTLWGEGDFPFLFVQLANYMDANPDPVESAWAELREAQTMALSLPNTGMAVTIDIGNAKDIHPRNKQDVGLRLDAEAERIVYGLKIGSRGPLYKSMVIHGDSIRINFEDNGTILECKDKYGYLKGFTIAGEDRKFVWAKAYLDGNSVVVYSSEVKKPVAVRYAWANNPDDANLYIRQGIPVSPFRTDNWEGITANRK